MGEGVGWRSIYQGKDKTWIKLSGGRNLIQAGCLPPVEAGVTTYLI